MDYIKGFGKLGGPNTVNVDLTEGGKQSLETKNILIATGSEVTPLPPVPVDNSQGKIVDSTGALELKEVILEDDSCTLQVHCTYINSKVSSRRERKGEERFRC